MKQGRNMKVLRFIGLATGVILVGCNAGKDGVLNREVIFDARTRNILTNATKVEVFRIDGGSSEHQPVIKKGEDSFGGFPVVARLPEQGKDFAGRLAAALLERGRYRDNTVKCFWPGVGYRVWKGEEPAEVLICFTCNNLYCGPPQKEARENAMFKQTARRDLLQLAKEAFPSDKDIQALKDE
jgi:hypothetical protein